MPEKGVFQAPLSGRIQILGSAGRVEIVKMDQLGTCSFLGFRRVSFYLKARKAESEIGDVKNRQVLDF